MKASVSFCFLLFPSVLFLASCSAPMRDSYETATQALENFSLSQSVSQTKLWDLTATHAKLLEDKNSIALSYPRMDLYKHGGKISKAQAVSGEVATDTQDLRLSGSVKVQSLEDATALHTEMLDYSSAKGRFTTKSPVRLYRPGSVVKGVGLEASSDLSEIKILHQEAEIYKGQ